MRRDAASAGALLLLLLAMQPAYGRVFEDDAWRGPFLLAGILAVALAAVVRRLGGGASVSAVVSTFGLTAFIYLTALPDVGLLPDASSLTELRVLLTQAAVDLRELPAPAPATPAFVAALSLGTWVVLHTSHEVLTRFAMPGAALVPPVVLWALPLAVPLPEGGELARALPFLAVAGLILLLGTDVSTDGEEAPRVTVSGLTVGAGALALAVAAPLLLPGYGAAALVDLSGSNDPRGYQPIIDISERLQQPEERDVLQVRASERAYLRLAGLDSFDGATWRLGPSGEGSYRPEADALFPATAELPPEEGAVTTSPIRAEIEVLDLANIYVPTPYQPQRVSGPFREEMVWSTEGGFLATWSVAEGGPGEPRVGVTQGVEYAVDAARPSPDIDDLREVTYPAGTIDRWTQLPDGYDALGEAASAVYADAGAETVIDRTLALQSWFTSDDRFTYDLEVPALRGSDALERFVLEDRVGYCEYFATAMAVMLRETGIPARVAVGFLPGEETLAADPEAGRDLAEYTVSTADAHAWVEVLFPGYGWVTFEPTPRSDQTQIVPTEDDLTPVENLAERREREAAEAGEDEPDETPEVPDPDTSAADQPEVPEELSPAGGGDGAGDGGPPAVVWWLLGLLGVGAVAVVARRRSLAPGAEGAGPRVVAAQRHLLARARRYGLGRSPEETLGEVVGRWRRDGRVGPDADRFTELAQAAAFGGDVDDRVAEEAEHLVASLEAELRASVPSRDRTLAPLRVPTETAVAGARRFGAVAAQTARRGPRDRRG
jgi:transglutaminase-like putative cysteine protease